ncbi:Uncharacterized protein HZ326_23989 [Fusarium oxysporum f. sp. albedinis]|nr:Uncharacterized protein HZ326_23989 [Fusarium oxysporum f. sp. albedinis]
MYRVFPNGQVKHHRSDSIICKVTRNDDQLIGIELVRAHGFDLFNSSPRISFKCFGVLTWELSEHVANSLHHRPCWTPRTRRHSRCRKATTIQVSRSYLLIKVVRSRSWPPHAVAEAALTPWLRGAFSMNKCQAGCVPLCWVLKPLTSRLGGIRSASRPTSGWAVSTVIVDECHV